MPEPSKLSRAMAGKPQPTSPFAQAIAGARPFEPFTIPRLGLQCVVTLVPSNRVEEIEGAVHARMKALGLELSATTELHYELHRARRTLAEAVLDGADTQRPIGSLDEWGALDADVIGDCWRFYGDVRAKYDPVSAGLTREEIEAIADAVKKNNEMLLRFFGVRRLASYLLTTEEQRSSLAEPTSGPSGSQQGD